MKHMACHNNEPKVGGCYRLRVARQNSWATHLVLVLAVAGEWCIILDLEAHGQPNPAAGERLRWTNNHFQLELIPLPAWPLAARRFYAVTCGRMAECRPGTPPAGRARRSSPLVGASRRRPAPVAPGSAVFVTVA